MSKKLLIVDDNKSCSDLYKMRFEIAGWQVETAYSAEEAKEIMQNGYKPDAIIADLMLPGIQGDEYIKDLKSNEETKNIPAILLTALNIGNIDKDSAIRFADEVVFKLDVLPQGLVAKIESLVK